MRGPGDGRRLDGLRRRQPGSVRRRARPHGLGDLAGRVDRRLRRGERRSGVNGRPLVLRGRSVDECDENQLAALHRAGCNLILARSMERLTELLPLADVHGFLVLGALMEAEQAALDRADAMADHPSFIGWLLKAPWARWDADAITRLRGEGRALVGVELGELPAGALPGGVDFIACPAGVAAQMVKGEETSPLPPLLLLGDGPDSPAAFGRVE